MTMIFMIQGFMWLMACGLTFMLYILFRLAGSRISPIGLGNDIIRLVLIVAAIIRDMMVTATRFQIRDLMMVMAIVAVLLVEETKIGMIVAVMSITKEILRDIIFG